MYFLSDKKEPSAWDFMLDETPPIIRAEQPVVSKAKNK